MTAQATADPRKDPAAGSSRASAATAGKPRNQAIDFARGIAILSVILIHSKVLDGTLIGSWFIDRAVAVFIFLFGLTASQWWQRAEGPGLYRRWITGRMQRLLPGMYATLAVWWLLALALQPTFVLLSPTLFCAHMLGYLDRVGTGWFVTLILQLSVLFPAMWWLLRRVPVAVALALAVIVPTMSFTIALPIMDLGGEFAWSVFFPSHVGPMILGVVVANRRRDGWLTFRDVALGMTVLVASLPGAAFFSSPQLFSVASRAVYDSCLALVGLGLSQVAVQVPTLARPITEIGRWSYGIYLGQLLVHNASAFYFGILFAGYWDVRIAFPPVPYTILLLVGGIGVAVIGSKMNDMRLRAMTR